MALVPVLIWPPFSAIAAIRLPIKTWMRSLGEVIAVAAANARGWTVGKVDMAALLKLYGRGQSLIMHRILMPSCLSVSASASNRLSLPTRRST